MLAKCSVFIATSLDGFISREDGSIDWLMKANTLAAPGEDCGYKLFISTVDSLIMGRYSYEEVSSFDEWPYGDLPVVVMSTQTVKFQNSYELVYLHQQKHQSPWFSVYRNKELNIFILMVELQYRDF